MQLAEKIKRRREQIGLSQSELARRIGKRPNYICQIEKNILTPSLKTFIKIVQELNVTVLFLLSEDVPSAKIQKLNNEYVDKLLIIFNKREPKVINFIKSVLDFLVSE